MMEMYDVISKIFFPKIESESNQASESKRSGNTGQRNTLNTTTRFNEQNPACKKLYKTNNQVSSTDKIAMEINQRWRNLLF
jgi:hypothetical protein